MIITLFLVMVVLKTIQEKIQEKIESNHPSDPFDLKGLDRTKEVCVYHIQSLDHMIIADKNII